MSSGARKGEHLELALEERMQLRGSFFEHYRFEHLAAPEIDLREVDTRTTFLGRRLAAPLLISCMTGGTERAGRINRNLAEAAERAGVALGVGSQRAALEDPTCAASFAVRDLAPSVPLLANLGAVQLNYGFGPGECQAAVAMIGADALVLHLNPLQEAIQPEGQGDFTGLLARIGEVARALPVPVIVKEVGCGISGRLGRRLAEQGVRIVDVAGLGGTSWARIEAERAGAAEIGETFAGWGIPTPECIRELRGVPGLTLIASGGVRNGVDAAKAIALGADLAGMAFPFLESAAVAADGVVARIERIVRELRISMFCVGARNLEELGRAELRPAFPWSRA